jgi:hypothetical protein
MRTPGWSTSLTECFEEPEAKSSGLVQRAIDQYGLTGIQVAGKSFRRKITHDN